MSKFKFQPRWKEELVVTGEGGQFVLDFAMGILSVYLPTEKSWESKCPDWARAQYSVLKYELEIWCKDNNAKFCIDEAAGVGVEGIWS